LLVTDAAAHCGCGHLEIIEKASMEELFHFGLITDETAKTKHLQKFNSALDEATDYSIFVSDEHGNGAGNYQLANVHIDGKQLNIELRFEKKQFEMGAAVMNRRVLFIKTGNDCELVSVVVSKQDSASVKK
jgi:hypothetical protein